MNKFIFLFIAIGFITACQTKRQNESPKTRVDVDKTIIEDSLTQPVIEIKEEEIDSAEFEVEYPIEIKNYLVKAIPASEKYDEIKITGIVAIGISDKQIERAKRRNGEDFYIIADDVNYYNYLFDELLDSLQIETQSPDNRYLKFVGRKQDYLIDLEKEGRQGIYWKYILFNEIDTPRVVQDIVIPDINHILEYLGIERGGAPTIFQDSVRLWKFAINESERMMEKYGNSIPDSVFHEFLKEYVGVINGLNKILYSHKEFEKYNSIIWADKSLHDSLGIQFEEGVRKYGYSVASSEGSIYIERNTNYVESIFLPFLSQEMKEFWVMYAEEINDRFSNDGGIVIPLNTVADRIIYWEKFINQYQEFVLIDYAKSNYSRYIYYLCNGMDNTPAFGFEKGSGLEVAFKQAYLYATEKYPQSELSKVLNKYLEILEKNDFKKTQEVIEYLKENTSL